MSILLWILVAGLIGWTASAIIEPERRHGLLRNSVIGIVSPFLASVVLSPIVIIRTINQNDFSVVSLLLSLSSAILLLALIHPLRHSQWWHPRDKKTRKEKPMTTLQGSSETMVPNPNPPTPPIPDPIPPPPTPPSPPPRPPQPPDPTPPAQL